MTPAEIRFKLEAKLLSLANERGLVPLITDVHSVAVEDNTVFVIYDIVPDEGGNGLHFEFERPQLVSCDDVREFTKWLAWSGHGETVH
jgi:hypothetical protein